VPSADGELLKQAHTFASERSDLLNRTVTDGIRITAVLVPAGDCYVAYGISRGDHVPTALIPLNATGSPRAFLRLFHRLRWDDEQRYLADQRSYIGLYCRDHMADDACLLRFDYNRDIVFNQRRQRYPDAHLHTFGANPALESFRTQDPAIAELRHLHVPVGGRRYRPTLEDMIEFAIVEGIANGRDGWEDAIDEHRAGWRAMQLRAAVRRDPMTAAAQLEEEGWSVTPPNAAPLRKRRRQRKQR
jgi:hypothetical protein